MFSYTGFRENSAPYNRSAHRVLEKFSRILISHPFSNEFGLFARRGIEIEVGSKPQSATPVPTPKLTSQIPTAAFTGSVASRDKMVLQLLAKGKEANAASDFGQACACFEAAYALSVRGGSMPARPPPPHSSPHLAAPDRAAE